MNFMDSALVLDFINRTRSCKLHLWLFKLELGHFDLINAMTEEYMGF